VISEPELERIVSRVDLSDSTIRGQVRGQMTRLHIDKALEKAGIKRGIPSAAAPLNGNGRR